VNCLAFTSRWIADSNGDFRSFWLFDQLKSDSGGYVSILNKGVLMGVSRPL